MTRPRGEPIIRLRDARVAFAGEIVYDRLSFEVGRGEFVCILGPSGCGKSTSLRVIGGLLPLAAGEAIVAGTSPRDAWSRIAFVFQSPRLVGWRTALDNVLLASELRFGGGDKARRRARALELLELVGLSKDVAKYPAMLSGGERQRVAIARALSVDPDIVLMDEPFSALDPSTRLRMRDEIEMIWKQTGKTIVFVTHDIDESLQLADRVLLWSRKPATVLAEVELGSERPRRLTDPAIVAERDRLMSLFHAMDPDATLA
ncbi:MAG: ABC transporter ATP-binding protein [Lautropia sp.]